MALGYIFKPSAMIQKDTSMDISVCENNRIRAAYSGIWAMKIIFFIGVLLTILFAYSVVPTAAIPCAIFSSIFWIVGFRTIRIIMFTDDFIQINSHRNMEIYYSSISIVINISPYDNDYHAIVIVTREGFVMGRLNLGYIPVNQGIIEHLKARGVKIRNFWFWQEK